MRVSFGRIRNGMLALLVVLTGMVVMAGPASAHQGTITVGSKVCVDADTVKVTYRVTWANVPSQAQNTHIYSRTGTSSFNGSWDDSASNAAAWANVDRGAVGSASGERTWQVTLDKSAFLASNSAKGPWEYAYFPWTNGNTGSRFHDTRVEDMDWDSCLSVPEGFEVCHATGVTPGTTAIEQVRKYESIRPSGIGQLSGHVGAGHQNGLDIIPPVAGYLPNGQNWTAYGQEVYAGVDGDRCTVPVKDAAAAVAVTDPTCASVSGVEFTSSFATASPATPNLVPGQHDVTFTSTDGHRFADGSRTKTLSYTVLPKLDADLDKCAVKDATASVSTSDPTCQSVTDVAFNAVNATAAPATPNLNPGTHSVTFTADKGHRFADGSRTKTVEYTVVDRLSADHQDCAVKDSTASVGVVSDETCTSPSVVEFSMANATADPAVPATEPGNHSVTFTADKGHRFADGSRTKTVEYTVVDRLSADHQDCAVKDSTASVGVVSDETCTSPSVVEFSMANATADPAVPATEPGNHSVTFTADKGHRFADGSRTKTVEYTVVDRLSADHQDCAVKDSTASVGVVSDETCTSPSVVEFSMANATADPAVPATEPGNHSVTFTADKGHRFADGSRTKTVEYTVVDRLSADHQDCAVKDSTASVGVVSDETCTSPSVVEFSMANATADPAVPATEPGNHSVTFTADSGHRFANGSRTLAVPYSIAGPLDADDDACAVSDASAALGTSAPECGVGEQLVLGEVVNATWGQPTLSEGPGDYSVTATAEAGHRFEGGERTLTFTGTLDGPVADLNGPEAEGCDVPEKPEAEQREVAGVQASCRMGGVTTWVDVYTTDYVWNEETFAWELGDETGPVRTDETFVKYTAAQKERKCVTVKGDEGETTDDEQPAIEVKGEQTDVPTDVPTEVTAGEAGAEGPLGAPGHDLLWLLAIGGGACLMGFAGSRRRQVANR